MKKLLILFWQVSGTFCLFVYGQAVNSLSPQSQNPGYLNFHSNLGVQEIIQIGTPKNLGPIRQSNNQNFPVVKRLGVLAEQENELKTTPLEESEFFNMLKKMIDTNSYNLINYKLIDNDEKKI